MDRDQVIGLLRCPRTGSALIAEGDTLRAEADTAIRYRRAHGIPVVVDFDRSLLDEADIFASAAASPVRRRRRGESWLRRWVATPAKNSASHVLRLLERIKAKTDRPRILVIGGGSIGNGLQAIYDDPAVDVVGFDIYASECIQFIADAHAVPLADASFDAVIVQAVLEHVLDPVQVVGEAHRLLRPGGLVYAETPFMQQVHEGAYDFTRFTDSGHRYLFRRFELIDAGVLSGPGTQLLWSIDYFFRGLFRSRTAGKVFKLLFFWLRWFDALIPQPYAVDAAGAVYFLGARQKEAIPARAIVDYYRGAQR
ncbi:MAG: class I SAM-dependent methyltransferase [Gammaproteobacteria bacterium]